MITYRELAQKINMMNDEQRDCNVTIHLQSTDEYYAAENCQLNDAEQEDDRLADGHPYLAVFDGDPATQPAENFYFKVEYDRNYVGGNYSEVGEFAYLSLSELADIGKPDHIAVDELFEKVTGINSIHIVHYNLDEPYYKMPGTNDFVPAGSIKTAHSVKTPQLSLTLAKLGDHDLEALLNYAGIVPKPDRQTKLDQLLVALKR